MRKGNKIFFGVVLLIVTSAAILITTHYNDSYNGENGYTLFIYMNGSDLETIGSNASLDLSEMLQAELEESTNVVIYTGGTKEWHTTDYNLKQVSNSKNQMWKFENDGMKLITEYDKKNLGDKASLIEFLMDGIAKYPAESYSLIFWGHGEGAIGGSGADEFYDNDTLSLIELQESFRYIYESLDIKFEFIGFDSCYMSSIEVIQSLSDYCNYYIASVDMEMFYGWNYKEVLTVLGSDNYSDSMYINEMIFNSYVNESKKYNEKDYATMTIVDTRKVNDMVLSLENVSDKLSVDLSTENHIQEIFNARENSIQYGAYLYSENGTELVDLADFFFRLKSIYPIEVEKLIKSINEAIIFNQSIYDTPDSTVKLGISIYMPILNSELNKDSQIAYENIPFSNKYKQYINLLIEKNIESLDNRE